MAAKAWKIYLRFFQSVYVVICCYLSTVSAEALAKPLKPELSPTPSKNMKVKSKERKGAAPPKAGTGQSRLKSDRSDRTKKPLVKMKGRNIPFRLGLAVGGAVNQASGPMLALHLNWRRWQWFGHGSAHQLQQLNGLGEVVIAHNRYGMATGVRYVFSSGLSMGLGYEVSWFSFEYLNPRADPDAAFTFVSSSQSVFLDFAWQSQGSRIYLIVGAKPSLLVKESATFEWTQITSEGNWRQSAEALWDRNLDPSYLYVAIGFYLI